jgi:hypothetical protein
MVTTTSGIQFGEDVKLQVEYAISTLNWSRGSLPEEDALHRKLVAVLLLLLALMAELMFVLLCTVKLPVLPPMQA